MSKEKTIVTGDLVEADFVSAKPKLKPGQKPKEIVAAVHKDKEKMAKRGSKT